MRGKEHYFLLKENLLVSHEGMIRKLCHREPYDYERERERRSALGLNPAAWDRIMAKRGSRPDYGGTWVVRDSEGTRIVGVDRGRPPQETIHLPGDPRPQS